MRLLPMPCLVRDLRLRGGTVFVDSQKQYWSFKRDYKDVVLFFKIGVRDPCI